MNQNSSSGRFGNNTRMISYFMKGAWPFFLSAACFAALVSLFDMLSPRLISFTVDCVIGDKSPDSLPGFLKRMIHTAGGMEFLKKNLLLVAGAAVFLGLMGALFRYLFRTFNSRGAEHLASRMRNELFTHLLSLPYKWHAANSTGDIIQRCTSDVQTIKRFVSEQMTSLVRTSIMIVMAVFFMARLHVVVTLASAAFIPVIIGYSLYFHKKIGSSFEKADTEEGVLSSIAQENLTGVRVVRAFGREKYERDRFEEQNTYYTGLWVRLMKLLSIFWSYGDIVTGLQSLAVIVSGAVFCVRGSLSAGDYIALCSYNLMLTWPVRAIGRVISEMSKAGISIDRLRYIMNAKPEADRPGACEPPMDREIEFNKVSYTYENGTREVLHDVSFRIPAGSTFGILGGTGSGKSTLMYLLERLYELPEANGRITVGGVDIADIKAGYLRRNIGMVLQEPYLFSRTLSENISIGSEFTDLQDIRSAARAACIDDAIESFTSGYETFVGERGVTLSGGQKQRAAIAQMLIRRPPVMIFDDSLSAVDAETDQKIRRSLAELRSKEAGEKAPAVILISHRITTLMNADNIIVLDKGRICEQGTHEQLLEQNGLYRKIFDLQTAGAEEGGTTA